MYLVGWNVLEILLVIQFVKIPNTTRNQNPSGKMFSKETSHSHVRHKRGKQSYRYSTWKVTPPDPAIISIFAFLMVKFPG